ncbi:MAG TPA: substrate-binding domain-containing protein, partial [Abditibacteriaceae bacterium]|nr:substrate-binding domain-containing protein [Abditibacteriaceae bacterium]
VEALVEKGCRRIGLWIPIGVGIGRRDGEDSFRERGAWQQTLKKHGLEADENLVWRDREHTDQTPQGQTAQGARETNQAQGLRAARETFGQKKSATSSTRLPDGIVIDDDMMTRGALTYLGQHGIRVGEDVQIATHLNRGSDVLLGHEDELSLVEIDLAEMAQAMFETLETLMRGENPANDVIEIQPKLRSHRTA